MLIRLIIFTVKAKYELLNMQIYDIIIAIVIIIKDDLYYEKDFDIHTDSASAVRLCFAEKQQFKRH